MIETLALAAIIGCFCNGLILVTEPGRLLDFCREWLEKKLTVNGKLIPIYKPLLGCATCMPSIWGTAIYLCFAGLTPEIWYQLPVTLISASAISTIIKQNYI